MSDIDILAGLVPTFLMSVGALLRMASFHLELIAADEGPQTREAQYLSTLLGFLSWFIAGAGAGMLALMWAL